METDDGIQDPVIRALAKHISSAPFQRHFEQFFLDNAMRFDDEVEHQLEYMTIYIDFQHRFNDNIAGFLAEQGLTEDEFADRFQKAIKSDVKAQQYLDIVLASMDYQAFYQLMKCMRSRAALENRRAEAKDAHASAGHELKSGKRKMGDGSKDSEDNPTEADAKGDGDEPSAKESGSKDSK